ncbi:hypothetical protein JCM8202_005305 [Rhodotorula sphaerocarpa]
MASERSQSSANGGPASRSPAAAAASRRICRQLVVEAHAVEHGLQAVLYCKVVLPTSPPGGSDSPHLLRSHPLASLTAAEAHALPLRADSPAVAFEAAHRLGLPSPAREELSSHDAARPAKVRRRSSSAASSRSSSRAIKDGTSSGEAIGLRPQLLVEQEGQDILLRHADAQTTRRQTPPSSRGIGDDSTRSDGAIAQGGTKAEFIVILRLDLSFGPLHLPLFANHIKIPTALCLRNTLTLTLPSPTASSSSAAWDLSVRPSLSHAASVLHTTPAADSTQITGNFPSTPSLSLRWTPQQLPDAPAKLSIPHAVTSTVWKMGEDDMAQIEVDVQAQLEYAGLREKQWLDLSVGASTASFELLDCVGLAGSEILDWQIGGADEPVPVPSRPTSPNQTPLARKTSDSSSIGLGVPTSSVLGSVARRRRSSAKPGEPRAPGFPSLFDISMPAPPVLDTSIDTDMRFASASASTQQRRRGDSTEPVAPAKAASLLPTDSEANLLHQAAPFDPEASVPDASFEDPALSDAGPDLLRQAAPFAANARPEPVAPDASFDTASVSDKAPSLLEADLLKQDAPFEPETGIPDESFETASVSDRGEPNLLTQAAPFAPEATVQDLRFEAAAATDSAPSLLAQAAPFGPSASVQEGRSLDLGAANAEDTSLLGQAAPFAPEAGVPYSSDAESVDGTRLRRWKRASWPANPGAATGQPAVVRIQLNLGPTLQAFALDSTASRPTACFRISLVARGLPVTPSGEDSRLEIPAICLTSADAEDGIVTVACTTPDKFMRPSSPSATVEETDGKLRWTTTRRSAASAAGPTLLILADRPTDADEPVTESPHVDEAEPRASDEAGVQDEEDVAEGDASFADSFDPDASSTTIVPGPTTEEEASGPEAEAPREAEVSEPVAEDVPIEQEDRVEAATDPTETQDSQAREPTEPARDAMAASEWRAGQPVLPPPVLQPVAAPDAPTTTPVAGESDSLRPPPSRDCSVQTARTETKVSSAQTARPETKVSSAQTARPETKVSSAQTTQPPKVTSQVRVVGPPRGLPTALLCLVLLGAITAFGTVTGWYGPQFGSRFPFDGALRSPRPADIFTTDPAPNRVVSYDWTTSTVQETVRSTYTHIATVTSVSTVTEHRTVTSVHSLTTTPPVASLPKPVTPSGAPAPTPIYHDDFTAATPATPVSTQPAPLQHEAAASLEPHEALRVAANFVVWLETVKAELRTVLLRWRDWLRL